jgi:hypothetical protein
MEHGGGGVERVHKGNGAERPNAARHHSIGRTRVAIYRAVKRLYMALDRGLIRPVDAPLSHKSVSVGPSALLTLCRSAFLLCHSLICP